MKMEMRRLKDVFPEWMVTGGIFAELNERDVPWADTFPAITIGFDYYGNFSGNKIVSTLIDSIHSADSGLTEVEISILTDIITGLYLQKWNKLWNTMLLEYNPIENYSMTEVMTDDQTITEYGKTTTRTDNLQHQRTDNLSSQRTDNLTHERTDNLSSERTDNLQHQRTDNLSSQRTDNLTHERTDNLSSERTDNLQHQRTDNLSSQRTDNLQHQRTDNLSSQRTDNLTHTKAGTETETPNTVTSDDNSVFGFNSETGVPSDSRIIENTGTNETEYDITETDTGTQTQLNTGTQTEANTGTQTQLNTGTQTEANTGTQTQLNTGTQTETNTGTQTQLNTGTQTEANTGTQTQLNTGTQTETDTGTQTQLNTGTQTEADTGTQAHVDSGSDTSTRNYQLTRSGNIGVTTSQQMITSELELWRVWNFFRGIVYPDIDRVITIDTY